MTAIEPSPVVQKTHKDAQRNDTALRTRCGFCRLPKPLNEVGICETCYHSWTDPTELSSAPVSSGPSPSPAFSMN
jgi:hypothetical protein